MTKHFSSKHDNLSDCDSSWLWCFTADMSGMDVLLVDDDPMARGVLGKILRAEGHRVVAEATDGAQALVMAGELHPHAIITDCDMPNVNGIELTAALRQTDHETPIIMISGSSDGETRSEALAAGVNAFLKKPVKIGELVSLLKAA